MSKMATVSAFVLYDKISSFLVVPCRPRLSISMLLNMLVLADGGGIVHLPTFSTWLVLAQDGRPPTFLSNQTILVVQVVGALA